MVSEPLTDGNFRVSFFIGARDVMMKQRYCKIFGSYLRLRKFVKMTCHSTPIVTVLILQRELFVA